MKIKKVVISQPEPQNEKSPYMELAQKYGLKIDFRPFIHVEGVSSKEFRQQKINILDHTAVIFTSKTAVDHFFRICEEVRVTVPETMKYFCITESIALYLQKYIVYRKRKIFYGNNTFADLLEIMQKHKEEKYLLSLSDVHKPEIPKSLDKAK
ncbi:MAG TPA: uroporphyrinogen-III synthase, partial [Tenuifilaceae bacterium]|nr:uroporphyrinogen-III synthase [Tenuifilaceae bacterium]